MGASVDTITTFDPVTYEEKIEIVTNDINPEDVKRFRLKEIWFFDDFILECGETSSLDGTTSSVGADFTYNWTLVEGDVMPTQVCQTGVMITTGKRPIPMHCEGSGSDTAGKCPTCSMDYVANAEHAKDGHTH